MNLSQDTKDAVITVSITVALVVLLLGLGVHIAGCGYVRQSCEVIKTANQTCGYVIVEYLDPNTGVVMQQRVPRSDLQTLAYGLAHKKVPK